MNIYNRYRLLLILVSALIAGCFPLLVHDYYRPDAPGGILKKSQCHESSGPKDTIEFIRDDVIIRISTTELENGFSVFIRFEIPKGKEVRLADPNIKAFTPSSSTEAKGLLKALEHYGWSPREVTETMIGETKEFKSILGSYSYGKYYALDAIITMEKSNMIKVQLPVFYINSNMLELPAITFTKDKSTEIFAPINC